MSTNWETILQTALRTPSPHNVQPWRVRVLDDRRSTLFVERARTLPDEDTTGHFLRSAMAMFLEAMRIIASNAGLTLRHTLITGDPSGLLIPFANLELEPGASPSVYSNDLFARRATSRLQSNGVPIGPQVSALLKQFEPDLGHSYQQFDDPPFIETIVEENIRAVFHDMNVPAYHDEIAGWFRCSAPEARTKGDGLDYRCMRVAGVELKLMANLPELLRWPLTRGFMHWRYRRQLGLVSHLGVISGPFFDDAGSLTAGKYLIRFWLELARRNLYLHPFGNLVTNPQAKARVRALTGIDDIWLVFRVGHTDEPPLSYRRPLRQVLVND